MAKKEMFYVMKKNPVVSLLQYEMMQTKKNESCVRDVLNKTIAANTSHVIDSQKYKPRARPWLRSMVIFIPGTKFHSSVNTRLP
jgi:hypothetical protein